MKNAPDFSYNITDDRRPQVLLIGNGLERGCKPTNPDPKGVNEQLSWDKLVAAVSVDGCISLSDDEKKHFPFPLMYSILSVKNPAPSMLSNQMINEEENRLKSAMNRLSQSSTRRLDMLKTLGADHILSTNYSYGLEQAFFCGKDFFNPRVRTKRWQAITRGQLPYAHRVSCTKRKRQSGRLVAHSRRMFGSARRCIRS